jgi:sialate O-acetylesterase
LALFSLVTSGINYPKRRKIRQKALAAWKERATAARAQGKAAAGRQPAAPEGPGSRWLPGGLYHAMIAPLRPMALRGVLWYQGESNASRAGEYAVLFPAMVQQWRADFEQPALPFYFVQLANFRVPNDSTGLAWAWQREAQNRALALPGTGAAVTIDVGEVGDIHPRNKQEVGRRLALHARAGIFGERVETDGPVFAGVRHEHGALRVSFTHADGLVLRGGAKAFEVAAVDRQFVPAMARVDGQTLVVSAAGVDSPIAVRYAWSNAPEAVLFNGAGLPASPFRSDNW